VNVKPTILWSMLNAWVTAPLRINTTEEIDDAAAVETWNELPYPMDEGALLIVGRAANDPVLVKRYAGL